MHIKGTTFSDEQVVGKGYSQNFLYLISYPIDPNKSAVSTPNVRPIEQGFVEIFKNTELSLKVITIAFAVIVMRFLLVRII